MICTILGLRFEGKGGSVLGILEALFGRTAVEGTSPASAAELVEAGAYLLDVRTPGEFTAAHIPGAKNIPLDVLERRAAEVPKDRTVVVACRSGSRSRMAIGRLKALGYTDLVNLDGGLMAWQSADLPVKR
jgi:rhodanese-related sulfurtransferase